VTRAGYSAEERVLVNGKVSRQASELYRRHQHATAALEETVARKRLVQDGFRVLGFGHLTAASEALGELADEANRFRRRDGSDAYGAEAAQEKAVDLAAMLIDANLAAETLFNSNTGAMLMGAAKDRLEDRLIAARDKVDAGLWRASEHYRQNQAEYFDIGLIMMRHAGITYSSGQPAQT
jgi:hypothetical protein